MPDRPQSDNDTIDISIVIPLHNEEDNVAPLCAELKAVLNASPHTHEVLLVDDGSRDRTVEHLWEAAGDDPRFTIVELTRNFGQTAALAAGFEMAKGRIIVPMDGDMQNDPHDIDAVVAKLDEPPGYDVVSGWRKNRHDKFITRRIPSMIANRLIGWITNVRIHDFGCTLKAYRREVLEDVRLYGEMHRFLPALTTWRGSSVTEMVVNHRPRIHGQTKYGLKRTAKVILDLITVKFFSDYLTKPLYFFGKLALWCMAGSFGSLVISLLQKFGYLTEEPVKLNRNVLVLMTVMLLLVAVMSVMMGLITELLVRTYHESQDRRVYKIRRKTQGIDLTKNQPKS